MNLMPLPGRVLVELREKYTHVATTEQKYDTKTSGICIGVNAPANWNKDKRLDYPHSMINLVVFWEEYKNSEPIERDGKKYAFVKIEDLDGYEDVEAD